MSYAIFTLNSSPLFSYTSRFALGDENPSCVQSADHAECPTEQTDRYNSESEYLSCDHGYSTALFVRFSRASWSLSGPSVACFIVNFFFHHGGYTTQIFGQANLDRHKHVIGIAEKRYRGCTASIRTHLGSLTKPARSDGEV